MKLAIVAAGLLSVVAAQNLIVNGGFESSDDQLTSWDVGQNADGLDWFVSGGSGVDPNDITVEQGNAAGSVSGGSADAPRVLSQSFATTAGDCLQAAGGAASELSITVEATVNICQTLGPWHHETFFVTASGSSSTLTARSYNGNGQNFLDNVSVVKVAASNCLVPSGLPPKRMRERRLERYHRRLERFGVA